MGKLDQFFFQSLPDYFKLNDTYVSGDKGILERYLDVFQLEAEVYIKDIVDLGSIPFPLTTPSRFVDYIAEYFGSPPDTFGNTTDYRDLLDNIIRINKDRGSVNSLRNFFKIMGVDCTIVTEHAAYFQHDTGETHDDPAVHHDGFCHPCVNVILDVLDPTIIITQLNAGTLTDDTRRIIQSILIYFLPVNASFKTFKYNGTTKDISLDDDLIHFPPPGGALPT